MPEPFKNLLGPESVKALSRALKLAWPAFPAPQFEAEALRGLGELELKARARHIADALERVLPGPPARAFRLLVKSLGTPGASASGGFVYFPYSEYLERHGPEDFDAALEANYELTKRFTGEFSLRSLLRADAPRVFKTLERWAKDESEHVRRLVSEGTRSRLPWGTRVPALLSDPAPVLALLEALKDDEAEYVRRSVANNLNDIAKDHPDLVIATCTRWLAGASKERKKLVEHALRTLVKKGEPRALALLGAGGERLRVTGAVEPKRVRLGEKVRISAVVKNGSEKSAHVVVDARVHFVKKKGPSASTVKVFKLGRVDLPAGETTTITRAFPMQHRTIRELHGGIHRVEVQVNGRVVDAGSFDLRL